MPLRLYRDDSYLRRFTANVVSAAPGREGEFAVELDRTAFYPTGGGQPHDLGLISGLPVIDVREAGDGRILHILRADAPPVGAVDAEIDWLRRFDHMQQHTGQHILSRAFLEVADAATTSFHLGETSCTIDVSFAEITAAGVRRAEERANEIVFGDAAVAVEHVDADRAPRLAADMNLQRELALKPGDPIRLIKIDRFDETPCGGTHVRRAGEVGAVVVRSRERFKGGTRVSFLCGGRVVKGLADLGEVVDSCVSRLSVRPHELPSAIARLQEQLAESRRSARMLNEALVGAEAVARDASARIAGACRVIVEVFPQRSAPDLQLLAQKYVLSGSRVALLATADAATGKATLVFARSDDGVPADLSMGGILASVCRTHGGNGGGAVLLARGGVPATSAAACLEEAFLLLSSRLLA